MNGPASIGECLAAAARRLTEAGIPDARRESRSILAHALGIEPVAVLGYPERPVGDTSRFEELIERRAAREPLSHLTGHREFWSLDFAVTPDTLDPRPDSETVVEAALKRFTGRAAPASILDLGAGTGCLLLALLHELPDAAGVGVDILPAAVEVARGNAEKLGLGGRARFFVGDWGAALAGPFDLIVANPPYIPTGEIAGLQREVAQYEPRRALDGGPDGLEGYRALAGDLGRLLAPKGAAILEFGMGQANNVAHILESSGLHVEDFAADLSGALRCAVCRKR